MSSVHQQHVHDLPMSLVRAKGVLRPLLNAVDRALQRLDLCDEGALRDLEAWFIAEAQRHFSDARDDLIA